MHAVFRVCLASFCLILPGCSLFGKKSAQNNSGEPQASAATPRNTGRGDRRGSRTADAGRRQPSNGVLAGRVLDDHDEQPPQTYIQVVAGQENAAAKAAPIEIATDAQGFFTIYGLVPGKSYQLIARTRDGTPKLAGTTWAIPPNPRVRIILSEEFATSGVPSAPAPTTSPGTKSNDNPAGQQNPATESQEKPAAAAPRESNTSSTNGSGIHGVDIGPPVKEPGSTSPPRAEIRPQDIAIDPGGLARQIPLGSIPGRSEGGRTPSADGAVLPSVPAQVPSCVLTGQQLHNFALYDLDGRPWEYRQHRGKLVLLDFWGTWCVPCLHAIPHLKILHETYGQAGLEVVGIAYESGTLQEQIEKVKRVRDYRQINYRLLLGGGKTACPVKTQFGVRAFPTLVLLDENNRILWQGEGLDKLKLDDLTLHIRRRLGSRD